MHTTSLTNDEGDDIVHQAIYQAPVVFLQKIHNGEYDAQEFPHYLASF